MTDEVQPGEPRRGIAGSSLRALRAARGGTRSGTPAADAAEVHDDPAELTDDPAVQPDDERGPNEPAPSAPDEVYADEVLDAENDAETAETGGAGHDDTDDPTIDDPSELTDDPSGLPEASPEPTTAGDADAAYADEVLEVDPATDTTADTTDDSVEPTAAGDADAAYADEVLEVDPATDTTDDTTAQPLEPATAGDADAAYADEVLEVNPATDTTTDAATDSTAESTIDSIAGGHDDTDDPTIDDPAELTDDPAEESASSDEAGAVSRVADPAADDEPPTLAATTPSSRRSKVSVVKANSAADAAAEADDAAAATRPPRAPRRPRRRPAPLVIALAALTAVALVFAVVSAVVWYRTDNDGAREVATARNDARDEARIAVATVNTIDYTKASDSLDQWLSVSTGKLRSQVSDSKASAAKILAQAKTSTTAVVLDAAVTSLDTGKGTATVILAANLSKKKAGQPAVSDRKRFRASMKLVNGEWKLADLGEVQPAVFS